MFINGIFLLLGLSAVPQFAADGYVRPTAEEALAFLKTLPPVGRTINGKHVMVQEWADKTAADIRQMENILPGGHVTGGEHMTIHGADWKYFTAFENVKVAKLFELHGVDDMAFYHMGHLSPTVKFLFVEGGKFSDDSMKHLQALNRLEFIGVGWNESLTDAGVRHFAAIPSLTEVQISGCPGITGSSLASLASLRNLKKLQIARTSITDATLSTLKDLTLEELNVGQTKVTFAGLQTLLSDPKALKNLKVLGLQKIELTADNEAALKQLRPGLKITK